MESAASINRPLFAWTDESCEILRAMWANGGSMTAIGEMLGCSRGAVSGKIDRLKLPPRNEKRGAAQVMRRAIRPRPNKQTVVARAAWKRAPLIPIEQPVQPPSEPPPNAKSFDELCAGECRWPYGDGTPYLFCGDAQVKDRPYCTHHCRVAYQPTARLTKLRERYEEAA